MQEVLLRLGWQSPRTLPRQLLTRLSILNPLVELCRWMLSQRIPHPRHRGVRRTPERGALVRALGAKLQEEAREATEVVEARETLLQELADVAEVPTSALDRPLYKAPGPPSADSGRSVG